MNRDVRMSVMTGGEIVLYGYTVSHYDDYSSFNYIYNVKSI